MKTEVHDWWCSTGCATRCVKLAKSLGSSIDRLDALRRLQGPPVDAAVDASAGATRGGGPPIVTHGAQAGKKQQDWANSTLLATVQERNVPAKLRATAGAPGPAQSNATTNADAPAHAASTSSAGAKAAAHADAEQAIPATQAGQLGESAATKQIDSSDSASTSNAAQHERHGERAASQAGLRSGPERQQPVPISCSGAAPSARVDTTTDGSAGTAAEPAEASGSSGGNTGGGRFRSVSCSASGAGRSASVRHSCQAARRSRCFQCATA